MKKICFIGLMFCMWSLAAMQEPQKSVRAVNNGDAVAAPVIEYDFNGLVENYKFLRVLGWQEPRKRKHNERQDDNTVPKTTSDLSCKEAFDWQTLLGDEVPLASDEKNRHKAVKAYELLEFMRQSSVDNSSQTHVASLSEASDLRTIKRRKIYEEEIVLSSDEENEDELCIDESEEDREVISEDLIKEKFVQEYHETQKSELKVTEKNQSDLRKRRADKKSYYCSPCNERFLSRQKDSHRRWHESAEFVCHVCKCAYLENRNLARHRKSITCKEKTAKNNL